VSRVGEVMLPAASRKMVRGSVSANFMGARAAEATHVKTSAIRNNTAGSGSLLPAHSIQSSARWLREQGVPFGAGEVTGLEGVIS